jgi:hypothetical protein
MDRRVIEDLANLRVSVLDATDRFSDGIKAQSVKCGVSASALRKYVMAYESGNLEKLKDELTDLSGLF